jgi:tetraacyldisaccharide 4'-kinase
MPGLRSRIESLWYGQAAPWWLAPLSSLYALVMAGRALSYRLGLRHSVRVSVPVVVVGNLTVGGTGKTPLVAWLAGRLTALGMRVAIVSRGYGGSARGTVRVTPESGAAEVGDEPLLLARRSGVPVYVGRQRAAAARQAVIDGADVIVSDDGLQHLALRRDCEIVVVDGQRGFGNGALLPRGPLRESVRRLRSVDAVVVNGPRDSVPSHPGTEGAFVMSLRPGDVRAVSGARTRPLSGFAGETVHAVAAIGNPGRFFDMLRAAGLTLTEHPFPDHHPFVPGDLAFGDSRPVLMTEKDAVKCAAFADERCWFVPVTAQFAEDHSRALVDRVVARIDACRSTAIPHG